MELELKCCSCNHIFSTKSNYNRHMRRYHPDKAKSMPDTRVKCCLCGVSCISIFSLQDHITKNHGDKSLSFETKTFHCFKEFESWKEDTEQESHSSFVKLKGNRVLSNGKIVIDYYCHRSGTFTPKSSGQRRMKASGSLKIGFHCPAHIRVIKEVDQDKENITVSYQSVHIGHKCEVGRMKLTREEKIHLAESLAMGIPKSKILSNLSETFSPTKRISYTTKRDLHNICRDFNIRYGYIHLVAQDDSYETHEDDSLPEDNTSEKEIPNLVIDCNKHDTRLLEEQASIHKALTNMPKRTSLLKEKTVVILKLQELINTCQSESITLEQLQTVKKTVFSLHKQLSIKEIPESPQCKGKEITEPANKKFLPQRQIRKFHNRRRHKLSM